MLPDFATKCLIFLKAFPFEVLSILVFFTLIFYLPVVSPDGIWWIAWAKSMKLHGFTQIYAQHDVLVNYFPATLYVVKLWSTILDLLKIPLGRETVYTFKIFPMIFDLLTVLMAYRVAKKFQLPALSVFVGLTLNIAFHYNSYIWGQLDSVYTFCIFLSLYFAATKKNFWACFVFLCALNFKLQAVVFLPIILFACTLNVLIRKDVHLQLLSLVERVTILGLLQAVLFLPFTSSPPEILRTVWEKGVKMGTFLSWNAYNFWIFVGAIPMKTQNFATWYLGMSFNFWGYLLFGVASFLSLLPYVVVLLEVAYLKVTRREKPILNALANWIPTSEGWLLCYLTTYLIALSSFFFLSDMHERYAHPVILFSFLVGLLSKKYWLLLVTSVAYFLNLNGVAKIFFYPAFTQINVPMVSASLYFLGWGMALSMLYALSFNTWKRLLKS